MRTSRSLRAGAIAAILALSLAACGGDETDGDTATTDTTATTTGDDTDGTDDQAGDLGLVEEGTLTVCSEIPYPPFEFEDPDSGEFTGFDIDLMGAVADELGLELSVVNTGFEGIQSGTTLAAGTCDVAASAMTINDLREEKLDFTDPYFQSDQSLLVKADGGIATLADTAGKKIGVQAETTGAAYAEENAPDDATLTEFSSGADAITALQAGQVDAVLQDLGPNAEAVSNDDQLEIAETYPTEETYGFAVAEEGSDDLLQAINDALATIMEDGTYDAIFEQYFPGAEPFRG